MAHLDLSVGQLDPRAGAIVEHKTGTLSGYTGDVGFLTSPTGRRIAVAFFARGGENRPAVIATAARMIYDGLASAPRFDALLRALASRAAAVNLGGASNLGGAAKRR